MAISIKNPTADRLARQVAEITGEGLTTAIVNALEERLARLTVGHRISSLADELDEIAIRCSQLPVLDRRSAEDIIGYDEHGVPR